ncbi:MAG: protein kinase [Planctomycetes bacterium]|nr:protein kinase [Planctomycetota bacterium]
MAITAKEFLESLSTLNLLPGDELATVKLCVADANDAEQLAKELVRQGKLTKYQAHNIYHGRGKGLVFGEYVVLDRLGAGGMGQVFKARHRRMKRIVAIKLLPPHSMHDPQNVKRFYQEVETAGQLVHPNIVTAFDAGETNGLHYLVMEYVEGKDLSSLLAKQGPLPIEKAMNCVMQAARGLEYAHGMLVVHRDIKPSNLLVDTKGTVKVLDMGLARLTDASEKAETAAREGLTLDGQVMGTIDYMAPEQARDARRADSRADIYSLGCTLYRLLTGRPVYEADTLVKKLWAHREDPIPSLRAVRPEVPARLDALFQKMVAKDPARRVQTASEVATALGALLSGVSDDDSSISVLDDVMPAADAAAFLSAPGSSGIQRGGSSIGSSRSDAPALAPPGVLTAVPLVYAMPVGSPVTAVRQPSFPPGAQALPEPEAPRRTGLLVAGAGLAVVVAVALVLWGMSGGDGEKLAENPSVATTPPTMPNPEPQRASKPEIPAPVPTTPENQNPAPAVKPSPPPAPPPAASPDDAPPRVSVKWKPGQPVDLLPLVDLSRDVIEGEWRQEPGQLIAPIAKPARVMFPTGAPREYVLLLEVERLGSSHELQLTIACGGRQVLAVIDANRGTISGLSLLQGRYVATAGNRSANRGTFLGSNDPMLIACVVRDGAIKVTCDTTTITDWKGKTTELSLAADRALPRTDSLALGTWDAAFKFRNVRLVPLGSKTNAEAIVKSALDDLTRQKSKDATGGATDLLSRVDPTRDTIEGDWQLVNGALSNLAGKGVNLRVMVPYTPPEEYDLRLVAKRTAGNGRLAIGLVVGEAQTRLNIETAANDSPQFIGLDAATGDSRYLPAARRIVTFPHDTPCEVVCLVRKNHVSAYVDNRLAIDWQGDPRDLGLPTFFQSRNRRQLFLGVQGKDTQFEISKFEISPPKRAIHGYRPLDLIASVDVKRDTERGEWQKARGVVILKPNENTTNRLALPVSLPNEYVVTAIVERLGGSGGFAVGLPMQERRAPLVVDGEAMSKAGVATNGEALEAAHHNRAPALLVPGQQHRVEFIARNSGPQVMVDGQLAFETKAGWAPYGERREWSVPSRLSTWVGGSRSSWRVTKLDVRPLDWQPVAPPSVSERAAAVEMLGKQYSKATDKSATPDAKLTVAEALLTTTCDLELDDLQRWATLELAAQLAAEAGDVPVTLTALEDLGRFFAFDPSDMEQRAVAELFRTGRSNAAREALADEAWRGSERAALLDQYGLAVELLSAWQKTKRKLDQDTSREAKAREMELKFYRDEQQLGLAAEAKLREQSDDREAHAARGRYLLLVRNQPAAAIADFESGSDTPWREIALAEQERPVEAAAKVKLGELWWQASEKLAGALKALTMERAARWYMSAVEDATGPSRNIIDKRRVQLANLRKLSNASFSQRHPLDAIKFGDRWYKFFAMPVTWDTARAACERMGGAMLCLESAAEGQFVSRFVLQQAQQAGLGERLDFWLGASDVKNEGQFAWLDGSSVGRDVVNWAVNEPNNGNGAEDHLYWSVRAEQGQIKAEASDTNQGRLFWFVCEWDH